MSDNLSTGIVSVALAVIGLGALAAIFSQKSQAPKVISSVGNALALNIEAATSPYGQAPMISTSAFG